MTILSFSKGRSTFNIINNLNQFEDQRSDSVSKISSALRIRKAADSVSESAIGTRLKIEVESLNKVLASTTSAKSALEIAEGGLSQVSRILTRMTSLAMDAKNGYNTDEDREKIDLEFQELKKEIDRIAESTNFNGKKLLTTHVVTMPEGVSGTPVKRYSFQNNWLAGTSTGSTPARSGSEDGIAAITPTSPISGKDWSYRMFYDADSKTLTVERPNWFANPTQWYWTNSVKIDEKEIKPGETETYSIPNNYFDITINDKFDKSKSFGLDVKGKDFYADFSYTGETATLRQIPIKGISGDIHSNFNLDQIRLSLVREEVDGSSRARFEITDGSTTGTPRKLVSDYFDFTNGKTPLANVTRITLSDEKGSVTIRPYEALQNLTNTVAVASSAKLDMTDFKVGDKAITLLNKPGGSSPEVSMSESELPILQPVSLKNLRYYNGYLTKTENVIEGSGTLLEETEITEALKFQVGTGFSEADSIAMPLEDITTASLGIEGGLFNLLMDEMLSDVIATLKNASSKVENIRSKVGVTSSRIDFAAQNLQTSITNSSAAVSAIFDLDVPTEISELSQIELKQVAAIEALSRDVKAKQNLMKLF